MNTEIYSRIEEQFKNRAKENFPKPSSKKFKDAQAEFFCGAMAAMIAISENNNPGISEQERKELNGKCMPPKWVIGLMRGDDLTKQ